jgi:hypothetical protein
MMSERTEQRFLAATMELLREAGWFPGRDVFGDVQLPPVFVIFPAAQRVLAEFGHLVMGRQGPGIGKARSRVVIDPMLAWGEDDRFEEFENLLHTTMYPLGEISGGAFLVIDEQGRVFIIFEDLFFVADTFDEALDDLLNGLKQSPVVDEEGHW